MTLSPLITATRKFTIGTRGSPLALAQANLVRELLCAAHDLPIEKVDIETISTTGDEIQDKALREFGGKGLFTKEIEDALLEGKIDMAVHSMKDVPTELPEGLTISAILPREDERDAFISLKAGNIEQLPEGARVGTSSLRRRAQLKALRPDLEIVDFRGNVETRLRKLEEGQADATFLAVAGLKRLGMAGKITALISTEEMLPALAQGAIGVECRSDDEKIITALMPLHHLPTAARITAERSFLAKLDGSCRMPIAGLAELTGAEIKFRGEILSPDGTQIYRASNNGFLQQPVEVGEACAEMLLEEAGEGFLKSLV